MKRPTPNMNGPKTCTIHQCGKPVYSFGLCPAHYTRQRRHGDPLGGGTPQGVPMKWLLSHTEYDNDDCLIWPFATARGYGMITADGKQRVAANYMCELVNGPPPTPKHECAHSCGKGNIGCVNPKHLRWATRSENHLDKIHHGTMPFGENNARSVLTEKQVRYILSMKGKATGASLARKFNVDPGTIYAIHKRINWKHL